MGWITSKIDKGKDGVRIKSSVWKDKRALKRKLIDTGGRKSRYTGKKCCRGDNRDRNESPKEAIEGSDYSP